MIKIGVIIIGILGLMLLSCVASAPVPFTTPTNRLTGGLSAPGLSYLSVYEESVPQTPYTILLESLKLFRDSVKKPAEFDQTMFNSMFSGFDLYFKRDDFYSRNCVYLGLNYDISCLDVVKKLYMHC